jgi:uncharacterized protein YegL
MKENSTELILVLDRSGSMTSIKTDMEGSFDQFIKEQKSQPGECTVTLVQFNTGYEAVYESKPLADVPALDLQPQGGTALLDALGKTILSAGERFKKMPDDKRPARVLFVIITDGEENSSKRFGHAQIKEMIEHQTNKYSWQFIYLGANQDAFTVAGAIGIIRANALNFVADSNGTSDLMKGVSAGVSNYRGGGNYNGQP